MEAITRDLRESGVDDLMAQQTKANALERLIATAHAKLSEEAPLGTTGDTMGAPADRRRKNGAKSNLPI